MSTRALLELRAPGPPPITSPQFRATISPMVCAYMFEVFLYGINFVLFATAVFVLLSKGGGFSRRLLLASTVFMFLLTTTGVCLSIYAFFGILIRGLPPPNDLIRVKHTIYLVNDIIADALLIYRCYAVWSRSIRVVMIPCVVLAGASIYGFIYIPGNLEQVGKRKFHFLWLTLAINVSLTVLMVTRVWWTARKARRILGNHLTKKPYSSIAIIIETGAIYSSYVIVYQVLSVLEIRPFMLDVSLAQVAVVAPLLIIVHIGLGHQIQDVETTLRLGRAASTIVFTTVNSDQ